MGGGTGVCVGMGGGVQCMCECVYMHVYVDVFVCGVWTVWVYTTPDLSCCWSRTEK